MPQPAPALVKKITSWHGTCSYIYYAAIDRLSVCPSSYFGGKRKNGMKRSVRVGLGFVNLPKGDFNNFAILCIVCLKNNLLFPNLPVTIIALTALQAAYQDAMNTAHMGGPKDTSAMLEARDNLCLALRQIAAYIQSLNLTESQVLTSGYDVIVWSKTKITLVAPTGIVLDNSISGQLGVSFPAVNGAKAYHVQFSADGGKTWLDVGIWPNTKGVVIPNLTPGTVYGVRIRGIGGSTQYSPWSGVFSLMAT